MKKTYKELWEAILGLLSITAGIIIISSFIDIVQSSDPLDLINWSWLAFGVASIIMGTLFVIQPKHKNKTQHPKIRK